MTSKKKMLSGSSFLNYLQQSEDCNFVGPRLSLEPYVNF